MWRQTEGNRVVQVYMEKAIKKEVAVMLVEMDLPQ